MLLEILYYLTIRPLEILFETIFFMSYRFIGKPFATIIALSIFVNILVFPLYKRADKLQAEQREREKAMEEKLSHIKKTFKGDEKVMMTQAYYRICDYKPVYALRGASSLLLQIPFFISAYRFLSGLELIKGMPSILLTLPWNGGVPSYLIKDLGAPDAMLFVSGHFINVLPILMTLINIVSGTIYSKGHLRKEKIQMYVTALVFLILLYNSPAGLVVYWTCNNLFSLCKNAIQKIIERRKSVRSTNDSLGTLDRKTINDHIFAVSSVFVSLFIGLYIPSNVIASSPLGFVSFYNEFNPARYILYSLSLSIGFYTIWFNIYYFFSEVKIKRVFSCLLICFCFCILLNYLMSGSGLGPLTADFIYDKKPVFETKYIIINVALIVAACVLSFLLFKYGSRFVAPLLFAGIISVICISGLNISSINKEYNDYKTMNSSSLYDEMPQITLSRTGHNVVVIMLDRALGPMIPYCLYERMDLMNTYDGFTYYHDTISYGQATNLAMPAVFGGYEYTPYEMNNRENELLVDKTDEALKVLPVLFLNNGYGVTVMDPPYAGYKEIPDLSIYDDYPAIKKYISQGKYNYDYYYLVEETLEDRKRNIFCFGITKTVPLFLHNSFYDDGNYNYWHDLHVITDEDIRISNSINPAFVSWYSVLDKMSDITAINDNDQGEFLMMYNCTSHEPNTLQLPEYTPALHVDNTLYDENAFFTINGIHINMDKTEQISHYHVVMASLLRIGEWLDYLKEQGVYDNTRIIIVSDHGWSNNYFDGFKFDCPTKKEPIEWYLPLLMVKDYDEHGFSFSDEFMTNADAAILAVSGGNIDNPINPFTGNRLDGHEKDEDEVKVSITRVPELDAEQYTFAPVEWATVNGSPYDVYNWSYIGLK